MGTVITVVDQHFKIPKGSKRPAMFALRDRMLADGHDPEDKAYPWMNGVDPTEWTSLTQALNDWRFEVEKNTKGDIIRLIFVGEKEGDEEVLFEAIGSYVEAGSYITFTAPNRSDMWDWQFQFDGEESHMIIEDEVEELATSGEEVTVVSSEQQDEPDDHGEQQGESDESGGLNDLKSEWVNL